ncbi:MAG: nuclear transport factor 2 family protein [Porticoccaceae bacterium]
MTEKTLEQRIDRLESLDEIRQMAAKYSLALDMRDLDAMANLFPEDVKVGKQSSGRAHLKKWLDETMRNQFTGTSHHIGNHIIEFINPDEAVGVVYSKNEHETPSENGDIEWVIMQMIYWDNYQRIDGRWYFKRRLPCYWYATDLNKPPVGDNKMRWPDREPYAGAYHDLWPSWQKFWQNPLSEELPVVAPPAPAEQFLLTMRGKAAAPKIKTR